MGGSLEGCIFAVIITGIRKGEKVVDCKRTMNILRTAQSGQLLRSVGSSAVDDCAMTAKGAVKRMVNKPNWAFEPKYIIMGDQVRAIQR